MIAKIIANGDYFCIDELVYRQRYSLPKIFTPKSLGNQPMMLFSVALGRITNATLSLAA